MFWENQGKIVTCRRSGFFGTFHELATIMCITDQAFSKFSGSAEARKAESRKSLGSVGRFLYGFLLGWKRERAVGGPMEKGIGWDSLDGLEGSWNYGDLESE